MHAIQVLGDSSFVCPVESLARADSESGQAVRERQSRVVAVVVATLAVAVVA